MVPSFPKAATDPIPKPTPKGVERTPQSKTSPKLGWLLSPPLVPFLPSPPLIPLPRTRARWVEAAQGTPTRSISSHLPANRRPHTSPPGSNGTTKTLPVPQPLGERDREPPGQQHTHPQLTLPIASHCKCFHRCGEGGKKSEAKRGHKRDPPPAVGTHPTPGACPPPATSAAHRRAGGEKPFSLPWLPRFFLSSRLHHLATLFGGNFSCGFGFVLLFFFFSCSPPPKKEAAQPKLKVPGRLRGEGTERAHPAGS